jgi:hypothetical protein
VWLAVLFIAPMYVVLAILFGQVDPILRQPVPVWNPAQWDVSQLRYVLEHIAGPDGFFGPALLRTLAYVLAVYRYFTRGERNAGRLDVFAGEALRAPHTGRQHAAGHRWHEERDRWVPVDRTSYCRAAGLTRRGTRPTPCNLT